MVSPDDTLWRPERRSGYRSREGSEAVRIIGIRDEGGLTLSLTCLDELRRTAVDGPSPLAKVGVAGSNPVIRSTQSGCLSRSFRVDPSLRAL